MKLAANISTMFRERPFLGRIGAAADASFKGIECQYPYEVPAEALAEALARRGLPLVLMNLPPGDFAGGERGLAALPGRREEFREQLELALTYARAAQCPRLHVQPGVTTGIDPAQAEETFIENLRHAADRAAEDGIEIMIEPINDRIDIPGYFLTGTAQAARIMDLVGRANVRLQYDIYHMQVMEGDLAHSIERLLPRIGHMQLADNPGRHEPGTGEIDFPWLLQHIDNLGYDGWMGCEYIPAGETLAGLGWSRGILART